MNHNKILILSGTTVCVSVLAVLITIDPFLLPLLSLGTLAWLALPLFVVGGILLDVAICRRRPRRIPVVILGGALIFAILVGLAIPLNKVLHERAVAAAKAYPERVAPLLEAYRLEHGHYPPGLDQITSAPRLPWLLRRFRYHSDGSKYWFTFPQPGGLIDVWDYSSETHRWHRST